MHRVCCLILSFSFVFLFRVNALMNHFYLNYISNASVSWTDIATGVSAKCFKSCFMLFPSWETWKPSGLPFVKILEVIHLQFLLAIQTCYPGNCLWQETRSSARRRHLHERTRFSCRSYKEMYSSQLGEFHGSWRVCTCALGCQSKRHPVHQFVLLSAKKLCYTIKLNRCVPFTLFIRPSV